MSTNNIYIDSFANISNKATVVPRIPRGIVEFQPPRQRRESTLPLIVAVIRSSYNIHQMVT